MDTFDVKILFRLFKYIMPKKGKCTYCRFSTKLHCTVGTYYAEKGESKICYDGELWEPIKKG